MFISPFDPFSFTRTLIERSSATHNPTLAFFILMGKPLAMWTALMMPFTPSFDFRSATK